jgi:GNAT superfamily N-acetyltransferase
MLPDHFLDHEVVAEREAVWRDRFAAADGPATVTVLAEKDGALVGFAHSIVADDPRWGTLLDNLHVAPATARRGIGRRLMAETAARLRDQGPPGGLYLWVLAANERARRFYAALGGQEAGEGVSREGGGEAPCLRIWWPDPDRLAGPAGR